MNYKLLLSASLLAFTFGGQACPDDQQSSQAAFRAIKVTAAANGENIDDLIVASVATGGAITEGAETFERLRLILGRAVVSNNGLATADTAGGGGGTYLCVTTALGNVVPTQITAATRTAILDSTNIVELVAALELHMTGN
ncbi:MAG: hypothetical protein ACK5PQ_05335 [Alphaproteobacteria bacterium]